MRDAFLPFSPPLIGDEEIAEVVDTLRGDWITTGPKTRRFEEEFSDFVSARSALAVASCTDGLQVALAALGIGQGDAVFVPTMTFCATAHVAEHLGATPIFVDIESSTLNLDPQQLRLEIKQVLSAGVLRPRAILPVHYGGHPCDMDVIDQIAAEFGLAIVEDAAHSLPATVGGRTIGDPSAPDGVTRATAFSFYATKNLTTAEGGMLTGPEEFLEEARLWSLHGMSRDAWRRYSKGGSWYYEVIRPGFKCNMTDIQAAIGLHQLAKLATFQERRRQIVDQYQLGLRGLDGLELPTERASVSSAWHLFPVRLNLEQLTADRAEVINRLSERNIGTSVHFIPVHVHPYYRDKYSLAPDRYPIAWREYHRLISLPLNLRMSTEDVDDVIDAVGDVLAECAL